jgi:pimeloyl-ACP methyl ester carboxylesterase
MESVTANNFNIAFERRGAGPPLVLLHGVLGDHRFWRPQLEGLAGAFTVIAWDAPGAGQSDDPPEFFSMDDFADCAAAFIRALGIEQAHVGGLSLGGAFALALYRRHSSLVRSLILADTYAGWKGSLPPDVVQARLEQCLRESEMAAEEFIPGWLPGLLPADAPAKLVDDVTATMSDFHPVGYRSMIRAMADADERETLGSIRVPTLLVWGEVDQRSPLSVAEQFRESIPGSRLVTIPGCGHLPSCQRPDAFNNAVREFCLSVA